MQPDALQKELQARSLVILGVSQHRANPETLVVYCTEMRGSGSMATPDG
jgi:hypothetical protein